MKSASLNKIALSCLLTLLTITGCKKDNSIVLNDVPSNNSIMILESLQMDNQIYPLLQTTLQSTSGVEMSNLSPSTIITFSHSGNSQSMVINYGSAGAVCWDGKTRSGKIMVAWSGEFITGGKSFTINTLNYYVDKNKFNINKNIFYNGLNKDGSPVFTISESDTASLYSVSQKITWNSHIIKTWASGFESSDLAFDQFVSTGNGTGIDDKGNSYSASIINPIVTNGNCPYIFSGKLSFTGTILKNLSVDFGNGSCDGLAYVDDNGNYYSIQLQ
jgi:hypothetical protein